MEAWLLADIQALEKYYGKGFNLKALSSIHNALESRNKKDLYDILEKATRDTAKKSYSKGSHSFQLIGLIDPQKVCAACPSAKALIDHLLEIS